MVEYETRWKAVRGIAEHFGLDGVLIYFDELAMADGYYLTGLWTQFERGLILVPLQSRPPILLVGPETDRLAVAEGSTLERIVTAAFMASGASYPNDIGTPLSKVIAGLLGERPRSLGVVGRGTIPAALHEEIAGTAGRLVDVSQAVQRLRWIKSSSEQALMRRAYTIADAGLDAVMDVLRPGIEEVEIAGAAEGAMRRAGAEGYGFSTFVATAPRSYGVFPRAAAGEVVTDGLVLVGLSPRHRGYAASLGISLPVGDIAMATRDQALRLFEAFTDLAARIAPGAGAADLHTASRAQLERLDLADLQVYGAIHSIGLNEAEPPFLSEKSDWAMEPGMVLSLDLATFHPVLGGIRYGTGYLIEEDQAVPLSSRFGAACEAVLHRLRA